MSLPTCPHCAHSLNEAEQKELLAAIKQHRATPQWKHAQHVAAGSLSKGGGGKDPSIAVGETWGSYFKIVQRLPNSRYATLRWKVRCTLCGTPKNTDTKHLRQGPLKCKGCKTTWSAHLLMPSRSIS